MADGQVVFEIKGDSTNVDQTVKKVTSNIESESKKWDQAASQATGDIEKSFASMAGNIVGKLTAAGIGAILLNWGSAAVEAASDLAEVQNVVDTVFGDGSRQIETWSKKAGQQFGLTELQAKKFTSTLGAMMKSSGLAGDEIISMSTDLAGLAADMASFYNLDFETAFEKIRSGISGETMPLKQLGINMSVANLEAFALAQGIEKTFSEMSQGEQTMLRYQYLMQATSDAQGDFSKTADGFANAQRRIQASVDSTKTSLGKILLPVVENVTGAVANFLSQITATPERTVLDDFNDIEVDTTQKMADLEATYNKAQDIIKLLEEISQETVTLKDGSKISFEELFADIGNLEKNGGDVRGYLESLGLDVDYVIQKYNVWKESTRQLTSLVPGLTSVIDSETGAIEGGTEALQKNLDEWRAYQEKKIAWAAYYAKERALAEKKGEMYMYEFDAGAARQAVIRQQNELDRLRKELGVGNDTYDMIIKVNATGGQGILTEQEKQWNDAVVKLGQLRKAAADAEAEYTRQTGDFAEAEQQLADGKQALIDKYGEEEQAAEDAAEATEYLGKTTEDWVDAIKGAPEAAEAIKAVADYYEGVRDATEQAVNSTLKGFEKIGKAGDELRQKIEENNAALGKAESENAKLLSKYGGVEGIAGMDDAEWQKLPAEVQNAYNEIVKLRKEQDELNRAVNEYSPQGMIDGLQSQIDYMDEYLQNLEKASELGLSEELLAQLSDGSKESAEYLAQIAQSDADTVGELNSKYAELQEKKKGFTDTLTENKLAADEVYDGLVQKAIEAIGDLNLEEQAAASMGDTVLGIAEGIRDNIPEVESAVDALLEQLNRLEGYGMSFGFGGGGLEFLFHLDGEHATGLNYVPFDGYLAGLHEGEGILTAEENRIWQRFKNGQGSGVDYDALGGVMRDNVHAGGNVYLDGRTVGKVVSDMQGNQYRSLQRSGWQQ